MDHNMRFNRTSLIAGDDMMSRLADTKVIIFGVGGVGSWCAEALVRTGIGHITIIDSDVVAESNINRQIMAMTSTVGRPKVDILAERFIDINPDLDIKAIQAIYAPETASKFDIESYDYVIDAIDSLNNKAHLILEATSYDNVRFFSSMGAALKLSSAKIQTAEFWKVEGCPLARALRQKFKRSGVMPHNKFLCVYSPERLRNRKEADQSAMSEEDDYWSPRKAAINGTFAHTTAIFGMTLAGLVIEDLYAKG